MKTTGLPSGQAETPANSLWVILSLLRRFSVSSMLRLNVDPCCFSNLTSSMFLLSLIEVLIDVILLYDGPPAPGPPLDEDDAGPQEPPKEPPVDSFL